MGGLHSRYFISDDFCETVAKECTEDRVKSAMTSVENRTGQRVVRRE